jgi:hypothetical protein
MPSRGASFDPWYVEMLAEVGFCWDADLLARASDSEDRGTLLLGQEVQFQYGMPRSQAEYLVWRRSQLDVHPTLRLKVQDLGVRLGIPLEVVEDVGLGYVERRGEQTLFHRPAA